VGEGRASVLLVSPLAFLDDGYFFQITAQPSHAFDTIDRNGRGEKVRTDASFVGTPISKERERTARSTRFCFTRLRPCAFRPRLLLARTQGLQAGSPADFQCGLLGAEDCGKQQARQEGTGSASNGWLAYCRNMGMQTQKHRFSLPPHREAHSDG
jgi:hypothetical protein